MKSAYLMSCLVSFCIVSSISPSVYGMDVGDHPEIQRDAVQLYRTVYNPLRGAKLEHEEVCEELDLIVKAFKEINIIPLGVLASGSSDDFSLFCTLPPNFIHFVNSREDVPPSQRKNMMRADGRDPKYHCDFKYNLTSSQKTGFLKEGIRLGHGTFSAPDISIGLWGYKDAHSPQILATPNTAILQLNVMRGMEGLKRGLESIVKEKLVEGFYVVVPQDTKQIDWQNGEGIVEKLKQDEKNYRYQWWSNN